MAYNILVLAARKPGVSHATFKTRYENHMSMVTKLAGSAGPLSHTRWYIQHHDNDKPAFLAGEAEGICYDAVVLMTFRDEAASRGFFGVLAGDEAKGLIEADEEGFWDREKMKVMVVGDVGQSVADVGVGS
jgi:hypothetical protein